MSKLFHFTAEEERAITLAMVESKIFMADYGKPPKLPPPPKKLIFKEETEPENSNEEDNENQIQEAK